MGTSMIRKQMYIEPQQQEKLRRFARDRHCTEAELVRQAIDALPKQQDPGLATLRAEGLIAESSEPMPSDAEIQRLERAWNQVMESLGDIHLSDAVLEDREGRDVSLLGHLRDGQTRHP